MKTPLLPSRRKAAELADVLDRRRDSSDAEVRRLVGLAEAVRALPAVQPDTDFAAGLRAQLVATAERELLPTQRGGETSRRAPVSTASPMRRRVGLAAAAGTFVAIGGGAGLASASAAAIPGELLYPVKRGAEQVELALATSDGSQGRAELDMGETRLTEVGALLGSDDPATSGRVVDTLEDFTASAAAGGDHLLSSYEQTGDPEDLQVLHEYAEGYGDTLTDLGSMLPIEAAEAFAAAAATVSTIDQQAIDLCPSCVDGDASVTVSTDLVTAGWQAIISPADGEGLIAVGGLPAAGTDQAALGVQLPTVDPADLTGGNGNEGPGNVEQPGTTPPTTPPVSPPSTGNGSDVEVELGNPNDALNDTDLNNAVDDLLGGSNGGGGGGGGNNVVDDVVDEVPVTPPDLELP